MPGEVDTFHLSQKCMFWEEQDPSKTYSSHLSFIKHAQLDKKIALRSSDHTADFNYSEWRDGDDIWKKIKLYTPPYWSLRKCLVFKGNGSRNLRRMKRSSTATSILSCLVFILFLKSLLGLDNNHLFSESYIY